MTTTTYMGKAATLDGSLARSSTPDSGTFANALEESTAKRWDIAAGASAQEAIWDAGAGETITLDGIGLARLNLPGATILLRHRDTITDAWTVAATITGPQTMQHVAQRFTSASARYWSLQISPPAGGGSISWVWLGEWLAFEYGPSPPFTPPSVAATYSNTTHLNSQAQILGSRAFQIAGTTQLNMPYVTLRWLKDDFEPLRRDLMQGKPAFFLPDDSLTDEVGLVILSGSNITVRQTFQAMGSLNMTLNYIP